MFNNIYQGKVVLVTGNSGFKGSWLTSWLIKIGAKVVGISFDVPTSPSMFELLGLQEHIDHFVADVNDTEAIRRIVEQVQPDFVFHLAAQAIVWKSLADPVNTIQTNVMGTANVLDALRRTGKKCVAVMITSDKCYENVEWTWGYRENDRLGGKDPYSASKAGAEMVIHTYYKTFFSAPDSLVRVASTRAGNVIGGGDWADNRIIPDTMRAWSDSKPVLIRNPKATRPWQHVLEPISGYLHLGAQLSVNPTLNGEAFNFGPGSEEVHTVAEVLESLAEKWEFSDDHEKIVYQATNDFHEAGLLKLSCDKAFHTLEWRAVLSLDTVARMTVDWYQNYYRSGKEKMYDLTLGQLDEYVLHAGRAGLKWVN